MAKKEKSDKKMLICDVIIGRPTKSGNGSHIVMPITWLRKRVMIVKLER